MTRVAFDDHDGQHLPCKSSNFRELREQRCRDAIKEEGLCLFAEGVLVEVKLSPVNSYNLLLCEAQLFDEEPPKFLSCLVTVIVPLTELCKDEELLPDLCVLPLDHQVLGKIARDSLEGKFSATENLLENRWYNDGSVLEVKAPPE